MSTIEISSKFKLHREGRYEMFSIQNECNECGWVGRKHYAHEDLQHQNCKQERMLHKCASQ